MKDKNQEIFLQEYEKIKTQLASSIERMTQEIDNSDDFSQAYTHIFVNLNRGYVESVKKYSDNDITPRELLAFINEVVLKQVNEQVL